MNKRFSTDGMERFRLLLPGMYGSNEEENISFENWGYSLIFPLQADLLIQQKEPLAADLFLVFFRTGFLKQVVLPHVGCNVSPGAKQSSSHDTELLP